MKQDPAALAHGIQVVGHARHNVAGAVFLVKSESCRSSCKKRVAKVELDLPGDADEYPPLCVEEKALDEVDGDEHASEKYDALPWYAPLSSSIVFFNIWGP